MGRKLTLKIANYMIEKTIQIREKLTIKNLKIIIAKELNLGKDEIEAFGKNNVLKDHQKICETEIRNGDEIILN